MLIIGRLGFGGVSQMLTRGEGGKPNADHCLKKVIANLICKLTSLSYLGLSNEFQFWRFPYINLSSVPWFWSQNWSDITIDTKRCNPIMGHMEDWKNCLKMMPRGSEGRALSIPCAARIHPLWPTATAGQALPVLLRHCTVWCASISCWFIHHKQYEVMHTNNRNNVEKVTDRIIWTLSSRP